MMLGRRLVRSPILRTPRGGFVRFRPVFYSSMPEEPAATTFTKTDDNMPEPDQQAVKPKRRVSDVLALKDKLPFTLPDTATINDAITHLTEHKMTSSLAVNTNGEISGLFTAWDIVKFLHDKGGVSTAAKGGALRSIVSEMMTKRERMIYCSPSDSVRRCREIMFQLRISNMPVIEDGEALGIVTFKDLANSAFSLEESGGKKGFMHNINGRKGLPEGTKLKREVSAVAKNLPKLQIEIGHFAMPHPFKSKDGCAWNRRGFGSKELNTDMQLCEDAHFAIQTKGTCNNTQTYLCVADGVGNWRSHGVDPRLYAHKLVENAKKIVESDAAQRGMEADSLLGFAAQDPIHPLDVIIEAWNATNSEGINGSSTICVATLDNKLNQLAYSNLGDCGLAVIRHIDSQTAGYMRDRNSPRHLRTNDLRIAYLSQQQLKGFNLPYQLGYSSLDDYQPEFQTPLDSDTASIPLIPGDIILMATDGLFDNLDLDDIVKEISSWERTYFPSITREELSRPSHKGQEALDDLASRLVKKARELSLDEQRDSPFALLAKENDIMWGGGMPDDTTVVVARVIEADGCEG